MKIWIDWDNRETFTEEQIKECVENLLAQEPFEDEDFNNWLEDSYSPATILEMATKDNNCKATLLNEYEKEKLDRRIYEFKDCLDEITI